MTDSRQPPLLFTDDLDETTLAAYRKSRYLAVDTETRGLQIKRDRLCLVQMCNEAGLTALVRIERYDAPRLRSLLEDPGIEKLMHFARFDMASIRHWLGVACQPVFCTRIASRLARTYTNRHGLKDLAAELLGITLDKAQQSSDWAAADLSADQMHYAAGDVIHLVALREKLEPMLKRENLWPLALEVMAGLPARVNLDLAGWEDEDLYAHT